MSDAPDLIEAGVYPDIQTAADRALVCLALGAGYWLFEENGEFVLYVEVTEYERLAPELAAFEREEAARLPAGREPGAASAVSIFVFVWVMLIAFLIQSRDPDRWVEFGGTSRALTIEAGEWWRAWTALLLHGDIVHLASNIFFGAIFIYAVLPLLGAPLAWAAILLAGGLGNLVNSALSLDRHVTTIGASTAVFATLGVLTACRARDAAGRSLRQNVRRVLLPVGSGLALLALYGAGEADARGQQIDYMAHLFGFAMGLLTGAAVWGWRKSDSPRAADTAR